MTLTKPEKSINLDSPEFFFNRELSLLEFQSRVLAEAEGKRHPLLERLKFLIILSTNLDEFFMIRVAGLKSQAANDVLELSFDGMSPEQQLLEIRRRLAPMYKQQEQLLIKDIMPELEKNGVVVHSYKNLDEDDSKHLKKYFIEDVLPGLTPLSLGPANPFPRLINRSLNIAFVLKDKKGHHHEKHVAFVQIPAFLNRFVRLEWHDGYHFVLVEQIIIAFAELLFPGMEVEAANTFRVTRDADIEIAEDEAEDLLSEMAEQIKLRRWGRAAVRLEVTVNMPTYLANLLMNSLDLEPNDVYVHERPLNLGDFMDLLKLDLRDLKDAPFATRQIPDFVNPDFSIFDALKNRDYIVHHPYDSFTHSTLNFMNSAADDPDVLAIKITLYRTGMNSGIVAALKRAAENGKYVTAFVELKARFDEEKNIIWAKELESVGAHVVYGVPGLKTHCKAALVLRRESGKLKSYLHLSTGNYNQVTAKLYTDIGYFTSNEKFCRDATYLFNYLTSYSRYDEWNEFIVAPINLRNRIIELIDREAEKHTPDNPGLIIAKMNSLAHKDVIQALYRASRKGVKIKLLIRGINCLIPGIPDVSDNIEVRSTLGRFLEHSRIFYFRNGGNEEFYLSSADWMSRNLHRRVEIMFPIHQKNLRKILLNILNVQWNDNKCSWQQMRDGSYERLTPGENETPLCSQQYFLNEIRGSK